MVEDIHSRSARRQLKGRAGLPCQLVRNERKGHAKPAKRRGLGLPRQQSIHRSMAGARAGGCNPELATRPRDRRPLYPPPRLATHRATAPRHASQRNATFLCARRHQKRLPAGPVSPILAGPSLPEVFRRACGGAFGLFFYGLRGRAA
jgi:hypothetical protein